MSDNVGRKAHYILIKTSLAVFSRISAGFRSSYVFRTLVVIRPTVEGKNFIFLSCFVCRIVYS